jgi:hypothetical protein
MSLRSPSKCALQDATATRFGGMLAAKRGNFRSGQNGIRRIKNSEKTAGIPRRSFRVKLVPVT